MTKSLTLAEEYSDIEYTGDLLPLYGIGKDQDIGKIKMEIYKILFDMNIYKFKYNRYITLKDIREEVTVEHFEKALAIYLLRK